MNDKIADLDAKIAKLQQERADTLKVSRIAAMADAKALIKTYKFTPTELGIKALRVRKTKTDATAVATDAPVKPAAKSKASAKKTPKKA